MKQQPRWIALVLVLALLTACATASAMESAAAADTVFAFRNGITWDTTYEQMLGSEGVTEDSDSVYVDQFDDFTACYISGLELAGEEAELAYYFHGDQLLFTGYFFESDALELYFALYKSVSAQYGDATEYDPGVAFSLIDAIDAGAVEEDEITTVAGWLFRDGTRLYLLQMHGDTYILYFNEDRILATDGYDRTPEAVATAAPAEIPVEEIAPEPTATPAEEAVEEPVEAAAAPDTFVFGNGVTWDTTPEQLLLAENADESNIMVYDVSDMCKGYMLTSVSQEGVASHLTYLFYSDQLIAVVFYDEEKDAKDFAAWYGEYSAQLGDATVTDTDMLRALLLRISPDADVDDEITDIAGWTYADGTYFYLLDIEGEIGGMYFNEPVIMDIEVDTTEDAQ